jgi:hypothetical protein
MKEKKPTEENPVPGYLIYAGPRDKGKTQRYFRLSELSLNDGTNSAEKFETFNTDSKIFKEGSIGAIYEVKFTSESSIRFDKNSSPIEYWKNSEDRAQWKTHEEVVKTIRAMKKEGSRNYMHDALKPICRAYKEANNAERKIILAEVIQSIVAYLE